VFWGCSNLSANLIFALPAKHELTANAAVLREPTPIIKKAMATDDHLKEALGEYGYELTHIKGKWWI
jgi:hypothetical protein